MKLIKKVFKKIYLYGELVMFSHTLFSLPFALIALFLAADGLPDLHIMIWSLIALIGARTGANAWNRYADYNVDKINPRTATRHLPQGILKKYDAVFLTLISYSVYIFAAYQINLLCFYLSPIPLIIFTIYPYTKRFTNLCHLVLGFAVAMAPLGAWMAVKNELVFINIYNDFYFDIRFPIIPFIIVAAVSLWTAGFDIVYATQDIEFDRKHNVFSIPSAVGFNWALNIARLFHLTMIILLSLLTFVSQLSTVFLIGVVISAVLLSISHKIVLPKNKLIMKIASYNINQVVSVTLLIFAVIDIFIY